MNLYPVPSGSTGILNVPGSLGICLAAEKGTVGCSDLEEIWPRIENWWWNATSLWFTVGWNKLPAHFQVLLKIPFQKASSHSHKALKALDCVDGIFNATEVFYQTITLFWMPVSIDPTKELEDARGRRKVGKERGKKKHIFISSFLI